MRLSISASALLRYVEMRLSIPASALLHYAEMRSSIPATKILEAGSQSSYGVPAVTARIAVRCGASIAASCLALSGVIGGKALAALRLARSFSCDVASA
jgi:hypothetical protein